MVGFRGRRCLIFWPSSSSSGLLCKLKQGWSRRNKPWTPLALLLTCCHPGLLLSLWHPRFFIGKLRVLALARVAVPWNTSPASTPARHGLLVSSRCLADLWTLLNPTDCEPLATGQKACPHVLCLPIISRSFLSRMLVGLHCLPLWVTSSGQ